MVSERDQQNLSGFAEVLERIICTTRNQAPKNGEPTEKAEDVKPPKTCGKRPKIVLRRCRKRFKRLKVKNHGRLIYIKLIDTLIQRDVFAAMDGPCAQSLGRCRAAYVWHNGPQKKEVWLAEDEVAVIVTRTATQWHLENSGQMGGTPGEDLNVLSVWSNYLGTVNEVIGIVDDAAEITHEDLTANAVAALHRDFIDDDNDPGPESPMEDHGTAVAGCAVARGFNGIGVRGVASQAGLAGLRSSIDFNNDAEIASALSHSNQAIAIYNNSWGPEDASEYLEGPGPLVEAALSNGVRNGRGGLGSIYVWSGGNGSDAWTSVMPWSWRRPGPRFPRK